MIGKLFGGLGRGIGKLLMFVLAIVVIGPYEGAKWLYKRVYKETLDYVGFTIFALVGSIYGAVSGYGLVHGFGYGVLASGVAGFVSFLIAAAFITPILWMGLLRWVVKAFDKLWHAVNSFARNNFKQIASDVVGACAHLPGSDALWAKVNDPNKKSFVAGALGVLAYPVAVLGSGYLGYNIINQATSFCAGIPVLSGIATASGAVMGALVFLLLGDIASKWLYYGKKPALALLICGGLAFGGAPFVASLLGGLSLTATAIAAVAAFVLLVAYVFPGFLLVFSDQFLNWVLTKLKPLLESAYDEKETGSRQFFHQVTNFGVTALAGWGAWWLCGAIGLSFAPVVAATAVTAALTYTLAGKALDWEGGNYIIGGALSIAAGAFAGMQYANAGLIYGNYGAIAAGVVTALPVFFLLFPIAYIAYRGLSNLPTISSVVEASGKGLSTAHDKVWKRFDKLVDRCQKVYNFAYKNERPYDKLVLQITNLVVTGAVGYGLNLLLSGFAVTHPVLAYTGVGLGTALAYVAGGQYIVLTGLELLGAAWGIIAGCALGALVLHAQPLGMTFAVPFGFVVAGLTYFLVYPLFFIGVRYVADPLLTGWLLPVLEGIHSWSWNTFAAVFKGVRDFLAPIFGPIFRFLASILVGAWRMAVDMWNSMFGRK